MKKSNKLQGPVL